MIGLYMESWDIPDRLVPAQPQLGLDGNIRERETTVLGRTIVCGLLQEWPGL